MTDRPEVTATQRWALGFNHIAAMEGTQVIPERNGDYVLYTDHVAALAACASQSKRVAVEAKIEALEAFHEIQIEHTLNENLCGKCIIEKEIARLRKEIE